MSAAEGLKVEHFATNMQTPTKPFEGLYGRYTYEQTWLMTAICNAKDYVEDEVMTLLPYPTEEHYLFRYFYTLQEHCVDTLEDFLACTGPFYEKVLKMNQEECEMIREHCRNAIRERNNGNNKYIEKHDITFADLNFKPSDYKFLDRISEFEIGKIANDPMPRDPWFDLSIQERYSPSLEYWRKKSRYRNVYDIWQFRQLRRARALESQYAKEVERLHLRPAA